jgi:succinoglycan biosynthesis transport protein ExoP
LIATQVGLLKSESLAKRVAEDLNLASSPKFADKSAAPATRLREATRKVAGNLTVEMPEEMPEVGQPIQFSYVSDSPQLAAQIANAFGDAFINSTLQRRYDSSS